MASDKIDQLEKERKEAEARQRAEKEEREAKIKRQERLVRILVFGGFIFVICYNLVKTFSAKNETIIISRLNLFHAAITHWICNFNSEPFHPW